MSDGSEKSRHMNEGHMDIEHGTEVEFKESQSMENGLFKIQHEFSHLNIYNDNYIAKSLDEISPSIIAQPHFSTTMHSNEQFNLEKICADYQVTVASHDESHPVPNLIESFPPISKSMCFAPLYNDIQTNQGEVSNNYQEAEMLGSSSSKSSPSIPQTEFQHNGVGQIECLNNPAAFFSSTNVKIQLHAENLQDVIDGSNPHLKAKQEEDRGFPMMNDSVQNEIFDLPLQPNNISSLSGNAKISETSKNLVDLQSHTSETRQTTNYSTKPVVLLKMSTLINKTIDAYVSKSRIHNDTSSPILNQQGLQCSGFSGGTSNKEYCGKTGISIRNFHSNTSSCKPESHEGMNETNVLRSTNILAANCDSKMFDFVNVQRHEGENQVSHLQSLSQIISRIGGNELADNVSLVSESIRHPVAGLSELTDDAYCKLQDGLFLCQICKKIFNSKESFVAHYQTHTGERQYACNKFPK